MLVLLAPHVHKINLLSLLLEKGLALSAIGYFHLLRFSRQRTEHRELYER